MQRLRLFIALELPSDVRKAIYTSFQRLRLNLDELRIVPAENLHVTVKFLGDTDINDIQKIIKVLESIGSTHQALELKLNHGSFYPPHRPRAVAIGIDKSAAFNAFFETLDDRIAREGVAQPEHRPPSPHITIARATRAISEDAMNEIKKWTCDSISFRADMLTLFESTLKPTGPVYTALTRVSLP